MKPLILASLFIFLTSCVLSQGPISTQAVPPTPLSPPPALTSTFPPPTDTPGVTFRPLSDVFDANQRLARTVNLGNALEAPHEGEWGVFLKEEYFQRIAAAGFTAVRIPIAFSYHAQVDPPYGIDPTFLDRIDWAVQTANKYGLVAIVDLHNFPEIMTDPAGERGRFLALWKQVSDHFQSVPDSQVYFELLNEPNGALDDSQWNNLAAETILLVRQTNPDRPILVGPSSWNSFDHLNDLVLPTDSNLIVTFHYYLPFHFTHQGAEWVDGSNAWLGTLWNANAFDQAAIASDFDSVVRWAAKHNRPIFLGEFGSYSKGDMTSRVLWTTAVRSAAEQRGFAWGYWEFCAGFGIYDPIADQWRQTLLEALIPNR